MITLLKMPKTSKGKFGTYQKIDDNKGIKIFYKKGYSLRELWEFYCRNNKIPNEWIEVLAEASLIKRIQKSKIAVKYYGFHIVKIRNKYFPVILVEHVDGKHLFDCEYKSFKVKNHKVVKTNIPKITPWRGEIQNYIDQEFHKHNFYYGDSHCNNVLVTKEGKIKVVDYSAKFCHFNGEYDENKLIVDVLETEFTPAFDELMNKYKKSLAEEDQTLLMQPEIKNICDYYWQYINCLSCDGNKISFSLDNYNEKRKAKITKYIQKSCSVLLKKKLTLVTIPVQSKEPLAKFELVF